MKGAQRDGRGGDSIVSPVGTDDDIVAGFARDGLNLDLLSPGLQAGHDVFLHRAEDLSFDALPLKGMVGEGAAVVDVTDFRAEEEKHREPVAGLIGPLVVELFGPGRALIVLLIEVGAEVHVGGVAALILIMQRFLDAADHGAATDMGFGAGVKATTATDFVVQALCVAQKSRQVAEFSCVRDDAEGIAAKTSSETAAKVGQPEIALRIEHLFCAYAGEIDIVVDLASPLIAFFGQLDDVDSVQEVQIG